MQSCQILYTANAGFFLTVGDITIAVDAFPREADRGFCALSESDFHTVCNREDTAGTRYVLATHSHPDHFCAEWNAAFLSAHPQARFLGAVDRDADRSLLRKAGNKLPPIFLQDQHPTYYLPGLTLEFTRLSHEGQAFADVPNYGCLLTFTGHSSDTDGPIRVLILGDAATADPQSAELAAGRTIDLALLNFPWITLPKGRRFLEDKLNVKKLAVLHLPYEDTDRNGYLDSTKKASAGFRAEDTVIFSRFGQSYGIYQ